MKYMLLMSYRQDGVEPMSEWTRAEVRAHIDFMHRVNEELTASGELVDAQGLTGPEDALIVRAGQTGTPMITDGPFPESKEFLAGYWMIDVANRERAIEVAAHCSAAPGPGGTPTGIAIEVRAVGEAPD